MPLEPQTLALLAEAFAGQVCCKCRRPAVRLREWKYYCARHYPPRPGERGEAYAVPEVKDPRPLFG